MSVHVFSEIMRAQLGQRHEMVYLKCKNCDERAKVVHEKLDAAITKEDMADVHALMDRYPCTGKVKAP